MAGAVIPMSDDYLDEPISYRRFLIEMSMALGTPWWMAQEAVASTLLKHPDVDGERMQTRREWAAGV